MAAKTEQQQKVPGDQQEADRVEQAQGDESPSVDFEREARLATDEEYRASESAKVHADQLKQQAENPSVADTLEEGRQATRAANSAEGGGAWPPEMLSRGTTPVGAVNTFTPEAVYTSHEDAEESSKSE